PAPTRRSSDLRSRDRAQLRPGDRRGESGRGSGQRRCADALPRRDSLPPRGAGMTTLLEVDRLDTFYGKSHVLRDLSFGVPRGRITTLLGRNGMGKTTTLRSIMGLTPPRSGTIRFDGPNITRQPSYRVRARGPG